MWQKKTHKFTLLNKKNEHVTCDVTNKRYNHFHIIKRKVVFILPQSKYKNKYHSTVVCIDSYNDKILNGRLYNEYLKGVVYFKSTMEFILCMSGILNKMDFPKPFLAARMFNETAEFNLHEKKSDGLKNGNLATFWVKIIFCQNSSWQGSVSWLNESKEESFRSALELLIMLDSALQQK